MESATGTFNQLGTTSKQFVRRLAIIGENRLELLAVEVQEGRERLLHAFLLALGMTAFGLLAGLTLTAALVIWLRAWPVTALLTLTVFYGAAGIWLYRRLTRLLRDWQTFSATLDQLQKDRVCLEKISA
jgi:uncharacterized membrane protein YqjE